jgi:hypothetical protein
VMIWVPTDDEYRAAGKAGALSASRGAYLKGERTVGGG